MSSTDTSDAGMAKMMGLVVAVLTIITIVAMVFARILSGDGDDPTDKLIRSALLDRIAPVASVRTEASDPSAAPAEVVAVALTPEELVQNACMACHAAGISGAPKMGDVAAWEPRIATGLEAMVASVVNGKGAMPAGGGSTYSVEDIERAVKHLAGIE